MAFLHIDGRGYFYLCESRRKGARVSRVKLAYLGRMEVPNVYDAFMGTTSGPNAAIVRNGEYQKLCNRLFLVWLGIAKPTLALAHLYCRIVSSIVPEWKERDGKIVARAEKVLKIIQKNQSRKSQRENEWDGRGWGKAESAPCSLTIILCCFYGASPMNWKRVQFPKLPKVIRELTRRGLIQYIAVHSVTAIDAAEHRKRLILVCDLLTGDGEREVRESEAEAAEAIPMPKTPVRESEAAGLSHLISDLAAR